MKKIIKKIGNSLGIIFNKEECKVYDLKKDKIVDFKLIQMKGGISRQDENNKS